jgi:hypothetical protein
VKFEAPDGQLRLDLVRLARLFHALSLFSAVSSGAKAIPHLDHIIDYIVSDGLMGSDFVHILRDMKGFDSTMTTGMIAILDYGDERWFRKQIHYLFKTFHSRKIVPDVLFRYPIIVSKRMTAERMSINKIFAEFERHESQKPEPATANEKLIQA